MPTSPGSKPSLAKVVTDAESLGGIWELGRTLAAHAMRARAEAA